MANWVCLHTKHWDGDGGNNDDGNHCKSDNDINADDDDGDKSQPKNKQ